MTDYIEAIKINNCLLKYPVNCPLPLFLKKKICNNNNGIVFKLKKLQYSVLVNIFAILYRSWLKKSAVQVRAVHATIRRNYN